MKKRNESLTVMIDRADRGDLDAMRYVLDWIRDNNLDEDTEDQEIHIKKLGYLRAMAKEDPDVLFDLAEELLRKNRSLTETDVREALDLYQQLSDRGPGPVHEALAVLYYEGKYVPMDIAKAYEHIELVNALMTAGGAYIRGEARRLHCEEFLSADDFTSHYRAAMHQPQTDPSVVVYGACAAFRLAETILHDQTKEKDLDGAEE